MGYYWVIFLLLTRYYILRNTLCTYNIRRGNRLPILYRKSGPKKIIFACLLPSCLILLSRLQSFSEIENILQKIVLDIKKKQFGLYKKHISEPSSLHFFRIRLYVLILYAAIEQRMWKAPSRNYYYLYTESKIPSGLSQLLHYVLLQPRSSSLETLSS